MLRILVLLLHGFVPTITLLANTMFLLQMFVPVLKRQWFWDARHELHFSVHWEWLGFTFAEDDVIVKHSAQMAQRCAEALASGDFQILETMIAEMKVTSRKARH